MASRRQHLHILYQQFCKSTSLGFDVHLIDFFCAIIIRQFGEKWELILAMTY